MIRFSEFVDGDKMHSHLCPLRAETEDVLKHSDIKMNLCSYYENIEINRLRRYRALEFRQPKANRAKRSL